MASSQSLHARASPRFPQSRVPWPASFTPRPQGRLVVLEHARACSPAIRSAIPHVRRLPVWLPPGYDQGATRGRGRRYPVLFDLVGFTGSGHAHVNWRPFDENVPERVARLIHDRRMGPAILVFPDCFTSLGGNQYVNSPAVGRYADYLTDELVPFVDREFRTLASRDHRGCFGKSSGGYGAIVHGMQRADTWGAVADHSGDAMFEFCYYTDLPRTLNELDRYRLPRRRPGRTTARGRRRAASHPGATTAASSASSRRCGARRSSPTARSTR